MVCYGMLKEITNVRQVSEEPTRRWFADDYFDLIVWTDETGQICGFQLCYNKQKDQHALTWHRAIGYAHNRVDDGEGKPGKYKAAPILVEEGDFPRDEVMDRFRKGSLHLEEQIARLVCDKLQQYPDRKKKSPFRPA